MDASIRQLRAAHFKREGDKALQCGNYKVACERYTAAVELQVEAPYKVYSNRSLAYAKANRFAEALHDAEKVIGLCPDWSKGHWRLGMAHVGMKQNLLAVASFARCWQLDKGSKEIQKQLHAAVNKLSPEQLGAGILDMLRQAEQQHVMKPADIEAAGEQQQAEAWYQELSHESGGLQHSLTYRRLYLHWLQHPITAAAAYMQRAVMNIRAKCYLQARWDAQQAINLLTKQLLESPKAISASIAEGEHELAEAYWCLGQALAAEPSHPDRQHAASVKALMRAMDLAPEHERIVEELQKAKEGVNMEQLHQCVTQLQAETAQQGLALKHPLALGILQDTSGWQTSHLEAVMVFPKGSLKAFTAATRQQLRIALSHCTMQPIEKVSIESMKAAQNPDKGIRVCVHVQLGQCHSTPDQLTAACRATLLDMVTDDEAMSHVLAAVGQVNPDSLQINVIAEERQNQIPVAVTPPKPEIGGQLIEVPKPKLDLDLPYKHYKLVRDDGSAVQRSKKHPFCMSRVYYNATERPEEVWTEVSDGSCRWRQSASEVKVMCLLVPPGLPARHLQVTFKPYHVHVSNKMSGQQYWAGDLERGIIPEDCVWEYGGGTGQDGCILYLQKMNLELLRRHWQHSEMWWPRLLRSHAAIQWDDYEKDYSDLPPQVMQQHAIKEAVADAERQQEAAEQKERHRLQEQDEEHQQRRQARLQQLHHGPKQ